MKADPQAYRSAVVTSFAGFVVQLTLAIVILIYAAIAKDEVAETIFYFLLTGLPIWVSLMLVFHQHRLERREAIEAEMYAESSAAQASVFEGIDNDLRVAAKRLAWMHKALLPFVSVLVGGLLIGIGLWRFQYLTSADLDNLQPRTGWAVSIGLILAVVGFIFARFIAGMGKQEIWSHLRAGAASMAGASLVGLALALAHGAWYVDKPGLFRILHVVIPVFMIVLGAEVFLNFVLNAYRPRRPGESPRPAFESRILGFIAAPDRIVESINDAINYQLGFDVTSTWFYQLLQKRVVGLAALGVLLLYLLTCVAVVRPTERALVLQSGRLVREVDSGIVFKAPWPFQTVEKHPARAVQQIQVGEMLSQNTDEAILWTNRHATREMFLLVQPTPTGRATETGATNDMALLAVELVVQFAVADLSKFQMLAADGVVWRDEMRFDLLRTVASRELMLSAATLTVDDILGSSRGEMSERLARAIRDAFNRLDAGVDVLFVGVAGAHPPQQESVALSFEQVVAAEQRRESYVELAEAVALRTLAKAAGDVELARSIVVELDQYESLKDAGASEEQIIQQEIAIEALLAQAGGEAGAIIMEARAERWERHMGARARSLRHRGQAAMFRAAPRVYMAQRYIDTLIAAAERSRLIITAFKDPYIIWDKKDIQSSFNAFEATTNTQE